MEVIDLLALPSRLRVENFQILAVVHDLVVQAEIVRNGLARVRAVEAVELLEMRIRDLADVLGNFDLRLDRPVRALDSYELIYARRTPARSWP